MSIINIEIKNFKSIKHINIPLDEVNLLLGQNGVGKSNILRAINHYYSNLTEVNFDSKLFDIKNPYNKFYEISFTYKLDEMSRKFYNLAKNEQLDIQLKNFVNKYIFFINKYDNNIKLTLIYNKEGKQEWILKSNMNEINKEMIYCSSLKTIEKKEKKDFYDFRALIKNMFPIYFVEARHINLIDWNTIWETLGDVSKLKINSHTNFTKNLEDYLSEPKNFGDKYTSIFNTIKENLYANNIQIEKFDAKNLFAQLYKLQLGGEKFKYNDSNLDFFSDGINSYNFLMIFLSLISSVSKLKLKKPLIMLDEPEIGLYPKYIDDITEIIIKNSSYQQALISTHSSRVVKNILKCENKNEDFSYNDYLKNHSCRSSIHHTSVINGYTYLNKINSLSSHKEKNIVNEAYASYYFSKGILFVEGDTEYELFQNKHLVELFPILKEIDIAYGGSNNIILSISHPQKRNLNIPYLILKDMDKIIQCKKNSSPLIRKIEVKREVSNPLHDTQLHKKERFLYGSSRINTYEERKKIERIIESRNFKFESNWFYSYGKSYNELIEMIKKYCENYNLILFKTTIEGALINNRSYEIIYEWIKYNPDISKSKKNDLDTIYYKYLNAEYRTAILRLLHKGKYETLENILKSNMYSEYKIDNEAQEIYKFIHIKGMLVDKTSGWITHFLNYYFNNYIYKENISKNSKLEIFEKHFKELYNVIRSIEKMMMK